MFIQHCRLSSALHLHLNKEVSIKELLNYLGVSLGQCEKTVKTFLFINHSGRKFTETWLHFGRCREGPPPRAHVWFQTQCNCVNVMRFKLFSLAQIFCCIRSLIRTLFCGKLKNQVKNKSRRNYLKNTHNNNSQSNLRISDGQWQNWQTHAFMNSLFPYGDEQPS